MNTQDQLNNADFSAIPATRPSDRFGNREMVVVSDRQKPPVNPIDSGLISRNKPISYTLSPGQKDIFADACDAAVFDQGDPADQKLIVDKASQIAKQISGRLGYFVETLHTFPNFLIIEDFPEVRYPRRLIAIAGEIFGRVVKYPGEGDYIIEIKEQQALAGDRPSFKNSRPFYLHSDLSYADSPPQFMLIHSIRNNPKEGGFSGFADIESVVQLLTPSAREELQKPQFLFPAPPHYEGKSFVQFPILTKAPGQITWNVRFRRDSLFSITRDGIEAIAQLIQALDQTAFEIVLHQNSMVLVNNRRYLHARTAFVSKQSTPRHLNRVYISVEEELHHGTIY